MKTLAIFFAILSAASAVSFFELVMEEWEAWKIVHQKTYNSTTEEKFRLKIYMENRAMIAKHNHKAELGHHTFFLKMNQHGDMLHHEFVARMNGYRPDLRREENQVGSTFLTLTNVNVPDSVDWRTKGYVTPIKNQGQCGSCWAFSTTGSLEGQHFRKTGKLVSLSEQNLVDCSTSFGNNGCNGGLMDNAFQYIKANGGIDTEASYPYEAEDDACHFKKASVGADDTGFVDVKPREDENALKEAVGTVGPVSVAIDASQGSFQFYSHGIYSDPNCHPESLDHGVLVVGYGSNEDGDYWIVKNSWGKTWGDDGYIKMARNKDNMCGIATQASYPLV